MVVWWSFFALSWAGNKMEAELAKMRERLNSLQKQFQRQHAGRSPSKTSNLQQQHLAFNDSQQVIIASPRKCAIPAATAAAAAAATAMAPPAPPLVLSDIIMQEASALSLELNSPLLIQPQANEERTQPQSFLSFGFTPTPDLKIRPQQQLQQAFPSNILMLSPTTGEAAANMNGNTSLQENPMYNCSPQSSLADRQAAEGCVGPAYNNAMYGGMTPEPPPAPLGAHPVMEAVPAVGDVLTGKRMQETEEDNGKLCRLVSRDPAGSEITMAAGVAAASAATEACSRQQCVLGVQHSPPTRDSPSSNSVPKKMKLTLPGFR
jgi:hypothetical protein